MKLQSLRLRAAPLTASGSWWTWASPSATDDARRRLFEVILPDPAFMEANADRDLGIVLVTTRTISARSPTRGRASKAPIYATPFTAYILREKLREADLLDEAKITEVPLGGTIELGPFKLE